MLCLYVLMQLEPAPVPTAEQIMAALSAVHKQWQKDVCLRSTFTYREGRAKTMEAGLRDGIDQSIAKPATEATGVFHRKGDLIRFSLDYGKPPVPVRNPAPQVPVPPGGGVVTHVSYDEVSNGRIQIGYFPGASGDNVYVVRQQPEVNWAGISSDSAMNPIRAYQNPRFDMFKLWKLDGDEEPKATVTVANVDGRHKEVMLAHNGRYKQTRTIRFLTAQSPAVITQIHETVTDPEGKTNEVQVRLSDFQKCPGGLVARRVVSVLRQDDRPILVREWTSRDLGDKPPTDADFIVTIEPTTTVGGLRNAPPRGTKNRQIDITSILEGDLVAPRRLP